MNICKKWAKLGTLTLYGYFTTLLEPKLSSVPIRYAQNELIQTTKQIG